MVYLHGKSCSLLMCAVCWCGAVKWFVSCRSRSRTLQPRKTAGPTLRGAARNRTIQEGPNVYCGLAVSPEKKTVNGHRAPQTPLQGAGWVCQRHGPDELDDTCHAESIATHNLAVSSRLLRTSLHNSTGLQRAKADVTEFTTLPVAGKPICEGFLGRFFGEVEGVSRCNGDGWAEEQFVGL